MRGRQQGVLGIAPVERSPHAAHEGNHAVAHPEVGVGGVGHLAHALDAGHDGRADVIPVGLIEPHERLGVVQPRGAYFH